MTSAHHRRGPRGCGCSPRRRGTESLDVLLDGGPTLGTGLPFGAAGKPVPSRRARTVWCSVVRRSAPVTLPVDLAPGSVVTLLVVDATGRRADRPGRGGRRRTHPGPRRRGGGRRREGFPPARGGRRTLPPHRPRPAPRPRAADGHGPRFGGRRTPARSTCPRRRSRPRGRRAGSDASTRRRPHPARPALGRRRHRPGRHRPRRLRHAGAAHGPHDGRLVRGQCGARGGRAGGDRRARGLGRCAGRLRAARRGGRGRSRRRRPHGRDDAAVHGHPRRPVRQVGVPDGGGLRGDSGRPAAADHLRGRVRPSWRAATATTSWCTRRRPLNGGGRGPASRPCASAAAGPTPSRCPRGRGRSPARRPAS